MSDNVLTAKVAEHPKLIGALFTLVLLSSQAGMAMAATSGCGAYHGP
ncbi:hypothetical protein HUG10_05440 [Halorarum halophilum]|uniref:Uncharacterized protein n=1 Tax=Halorarum halophilum TaxID=2743090 RepID=A0A7D5KWP6_9EURY|nr:hypothetical protein [Halobaculum halophilum]QLG27018.1 hypothetical protein HUG10_05440 [Halobaculum halophilum]